MNEELSRLMDGDQVDAEVERVVVECRRPEALTAWACYHIIGDTLRGTHGASLRVASRVSHALATEPTVLAPKLRSVRPVASWAWAAAAPCGDLRRRLRRSRSPKHRTAGRESARAAVDHAAQVRPQSLAAGLCPVHQSTRRRRRSRVVRAVASRGFGRRPATGPDGRVHVSVSFPTAAPQGGIRCRWRHGAGSAPSRD